jgi:hypothetical protein
MVKKAHAQIDIRLVRGWEEKVLEILEDCRLSLGQG